MRRPLTRGTRTLVFMGLAVLLTLTIRRLVLDDPPRPIVEFTGATMGTTYSVKIANVELTATDRSALQHVVDTRLSDVNRAMSTYDSTSELERFNRTRAGQPFAASPAMLRVMTLAMQISDATGGAFDVTVRPLVDAWGFGPPDPPSEPPSRRTLDSLLAQVGHHLLDLDTVKGTITKRNDDVVVDLSAIAKGFGVDRVVDALDSAGLCCFLVEIGGELRSRGVRDDGTPWRIGIERPGPVAAVIGVLELRNEAVATSGDYRNFIEWNGQRFAHIIDPRSGRPVPFTGSSVTVIDTMTAIADGWATALSVLGVVEGLEVAERADIAAHFAWLDADTLITRVTPAFARRNKRRQG